MRLSRFETRCLQVQVTKMQPRRLHDWGCQINVLQQSPMMKFYSPTKDTMDGNVNSSSCKQPVSNKGRSHARDFHCLVSNRQSMCVCWVVHTKMQLSLHHIWYSNPCAQHTRTLSGGACWGFKHAGARQGRNFFALLWGL